MPYQTGASAALEKQLNKTVTAVSRQPKMNRQPFQSVLLTRVLVQQQCISIVHMICTSFCPGTPEIVHEASTFVRSNANQEYTGRTVAAATATEEFLTAVPLLPRDITNSSRSVSKSCRSRTVTATAVGARSEKKKISG